MPAPPFPSCRGTHGGCAPLGAGAICEAAGLTRGSFYHHFADHRAFLVAMTEKWLMTATEDVAADLDAGASAADRMEALNTAAMAIDYRLEHFPTTQTRFDRGRRRDPARRSESQRTSCTRFRCNDGGRADGPALRVAAQGLPDVVAAP